jgi:hypothetical protein
MARHDGCFKCGGGEGEVLSSVVAVVISLTRKGVEKRELHSVALDRACLKEFEVTGGRTVDLRDQTQEVRA